MEIKIGGKTRFENLLNNYSIRPVGYEGIITNSRYALIGYFITSYPTRAHGIIVIYSPCLSLVTKRAISAISSSKHGGQLLNEAFIYSKDITPITGHLKGWRLILKMTPVALGLGIFFQSSYSRLLRLVNSVIVLIACRSHWLTKIYFSSD